MFLNIYSEIKDRFVLENKTFRFSTSVLSVAVLILAFVVFFKIDNQKTVIIPPTQSLKEFWIEGNKVSTSYLEMVGDVIAYNILNITAERKPNTEFIIAMTPSEHIQRVKGAVDSQIKYIQNNAITQVFYATKYDTNQKGIIKITGILKQFIGDKKMDSSLHTLIIQYDIEYGRFWIKGLDLKKEGIKINNDEEEQVK